MKRKPASLIPEFRRLSLGSFDCCPGDDFECVRAFRDLDSLIDFEVTKGLRGFACWPGDGELSDAGRVEKTEGFDKAVDTETRVVADSAVNGDGGIVGGLAVNLNPGAECSAVGFRANEFDFEPVAAVSGIREERVIRLVAGRRPAKFNFTRKLTSVTSDSIHAVVTCRPCRRYSG